jgi:hypothetical protein
VEKRGTLVTYRITLEDGRVESMDVSVEETPAGARPLVAAATPAWARLGVNQCEHCPLSTDTTPDCPLAVMAAFVR